MLKTEKQRISVNVTTCSEIEVPFLICQFTPKVEENIGIFPSSLMIKFNS